MKRFPTWYIWRLLHTYPDREKYELLAQSLHMKPPRFLWVNNLWFWVVFGYGVGFLVYISNNILRGGTAGFNTALLFNSSLPLMIAVIALHFAWQVTGSIIRQRDSGSDTLIPMTDIARAHRYPFDGRIRGARSALIVVTLLAIVVLGWIQISSTLSLFVVALNLFIGVYSFVLYLEMFTTATLIAFLVSQRQRHASALVIVIVSYFVLYLAFALASYFLSSNVTTWIYSFNNPAPSINARVGQVFWWTLVILPMISIAYHELVNFILWQLVKRRLEA